MITVHILFKFNSVLQKYFNDTGKPYYYLYKNIKTIFVTTHTNTEYLGTSCDILIY
jgi:hypothetical protein